jgi:hypothetical protein
MALSYACFGRKVERNSMKNRKLGQADALLLGGILAVGGVIALLLLLTGHHGALVQVRVDGTATETYSMTKDQSHEIQGVHGGTNLLIIQNGQAWVEEASCPDGLCCNMGKISKSGQSIVCLPNKVVIEVLDDERSQETTSEIDGIIG